MVLTWFFYLWVALLVFAILYAVYNARVIVTPRLWVVQIRRDYMADLLTYSVVAAAVTDSDVVSRELVVAVNGETQPAVYFASNMTDLGTVTALQNSSVELTLVDVDDAGNRSEPASLVFVALDTLAPSAPGSIGVTLVSETTVTPDEPVAPEVVDNTDSAPEGDA
jgi:hypothetical protein